MTLQYVGNEGLRKTYECCSPEERLILDTIIGKAMAAESLDDVMNFLFDSIRRLSPCNRISVAFLQDDRKRLVSHWTRADYQPLSLTNGYSADLQGSSLEGVLQSGQPRVINDLEQYAADHPASASTRLILREGIRSSMTCPLVIEDRPIGFLFRSSRTPNVYDEHQVLLHLAIADRLSQAVEKAYRIEQLTAAMDAYFEMLGFVSHELKSPLGSMVMSADVLLGGYLGALQPKQAEQLNRIVKKAKYLQDLVGEYLNLSRLESGQLEPDFRPDVDFVGERGRAGGRYCDASDRSEEDAIHTRLERRRTRPEMRARPHADRHGQPLVERRQVRQRGRRGTPQCPQERPAAERVRLERGSRVPRGRALETVPQVLTDSDPPNSSSAKAPASASTRRGASSSRIRAGLKRARNTANGPSSSSKSPPPWPHPPRKSSQLISGISRWVWPSTVPTGTSHRPR